jgi:tryptophan 2,3-dioxygenase
MEKTPPYYGSYLQLEKVLDAQAPLSFAPDQSPAHDEMLFIVIHQAFELWFKQILFELDYILSVFKQKRIDDDGEDLNLVRHRLRRINTIFNLLNQQVGVLDTMTPMDFLAFRNLLTPSSGFQSKQFRLIEARLGLEMPQRHHGEYYKRTNEGGFNPQDFQTISQTENEQHLLSCINDWLERMPFFQASFWGNAQIENEMDHPFWRQFRLIYVAGLTEREAGKAADFDRIFFGIPSAPDSASTGTSKFSAPALRAALFIMLYRDFPVFQTSFQILDALIETDHLMSQWRQRHLSMVRRMIGFRVGTGNTSGAGYLEGALQQHEVYTDLAGLSTFLIVRGALPTLPDALKKALGFRLADLPFSS